MDKYTDLINRLKDKEVYAKYKPMGGPVTTTWTSEVTIGRVLEMWLGNGYEIISSTEWDHGPKSGEEVCTLIDLWSACGFTKSLNQILEEKPEGWEALFEFLIDLFTN